MRFKVSPILIWLFAGVFIGVFVGRYGPDEFSERIGMTLAIVVVCIILVAGANSLRFPRISIGGSRQPTLPSANAQAQEHSTVVLPHLGWRAMVSEWIALTLILTLFALPFLNFDPEQLLPGNEFDVFATLDFVVVNALQNFGQFPLWNFYIRTGQPLIADPFLHVFNPFITIPVLFGGVANGYKMAVFAAFILAAIGQWLLSCALGLNGPVRLWSALIYALNGQAVAKFFQGSYDFTFGYAWIPFVFAGGVMVLRTRRPRYYAWTALALALGFFSGNVYYSFYIAIILGLFILIAGFEFGGPTRIDWNPNRVEPMISSALLALGLISIQLLPTIEFWRYMSKIGDPALVTTQPLEEIAQNYLSTSVDRPVAREFLPPEDFYGYIGGVPFIAATLALAAFWQGRRREIIVWGMLFVFVITWISIRYTPLAPLFERTPWLHQFRYPSRIMIFGTIAIIILGGIGLHWLMNRLEKLRSAPGIIRHSSKAATLGLIAILLFSVMDVFQANRQVIGTRDVYQVADEIVSWLAQYDSKPHYVSIPVSAFWHYATASNEERYWDSWYGFDFHPQAQPIPNFRSVIARPNYLVLGKDKTPPSNATIEKEFRLHRVYHLTESLPYAFLVTRETLSQIDAGELRQSNVQALDVSQTSPNKLQVSADTTDASGWIVVLTNYYPGWRVTMDGCDGSLTNIGDYIATLATTGYHTYVFEFDPPIFKIGMAISLVSLVVILGILLFDYFASR